MTLDWTQFTFIGGSVVAMLLKALVFKDDTAKRDKVLPVMVFIANFLLRVSQEAGAGSAETAMATHSGAMLAMITLPDIGSLLWVSALDTLKSWGVHKGKQWSDHMRGDDTVRRRRR